MCQIYKNVVPILQISIFFIAGYKIFPIFAAENNNIIINF